MNKQQQQSICLLDGSPLTAGFYPDTVQDLFFFCLKVSSELLILHVSRQTNTLNKKKKEKKQRLRLLVLIWLGISNVFSGRERTNEWPDKAERLLELLGGKRPLSRPRCQCLLHVCQDAFTCMSPAVKAAIHLHTCSPLHSFLSPWDWLCFPLHARPSKSFQTTASYFQFFFFIFIIITIIFIVVDENWIESE